MHTVARGLKGCDAHSEAIGIDDKLGWVLSFIRAAEKINLARMRACAKAYPHITHFVNPEDPEARCKCGMNDLRNHSIQLARQSITDNIEELREASGDECESAKAHVKSNIVSKLNAPCLVIPVC